jgi:hypothetical protein
MGKYASWSEYESQAPKAYEEKATGEAFRTGLNGIAPPGLKVKEGRVRHYADGVKGKGDDMVAGFKRAMFE